MGLSTEEQRTLFSIEHSLSGSDPALAKRLAMFTRLTSGEKMPERETITAHGMARRICRPHRDRHPRPGRAGGGARKANRHLVSQQAGLLLWLVIAIGLVTLALAVSRSSGKRACSVTLAAVCSGQSPARSGRKPPQQSGAALPGGPVSGGRLGCVPAARLSCSGESILLADAWRAGDTPAAQGARIAVRFRPWRSAAGARARALAADRRTAMSTYRTSAADPDLLWA